jgi:hypothetical protein
MIPNFATEHIIIHFYYYYYYYYYTLYYHITPEARTSSPAGP